MGERATVMRLLPDQIHVTIVERHPSPSSPGQQVGLVDGDGVLLTMPPAMMAQHNYSFPVVTASIQPADACARRAWPFTSACWGIDANSQHLSEQISESI